MTVVVRPQESEDPVAAVLAAHEAGRSLALATSGTSTGASREVLRSTESWWSSFAAYTSLARLTPGSRLWVPGPTSATMNLFALVHARVTGVTVVEGPVTATAACLTPAQLRRAMPDLRPGTVVVVAGAALPTSLAARAEAHGIEIEHYYGAAELSFVSWASGDGLRPFPGVEIEVRDRPDDRTIWVRSPYLSDGYVGSPGALLTDADGWATVGDLGAFADGRLTVLGRPDAIVTAGTTVLAADVEAALGPIAHGEFAVHASAHPTLGQVVSVTHVLASDRSRLDEWARGHLPATHRPRRWQLVDDLPVTPAGKLDRAHLSLGAR
jgi:acyl-CoA synthetase (AMP-forming)/AMP-acid ligase II